MHGDLKCPKCGNGDQEKFVSVPDADPTPRNIRLRVIVKLRGWKCQTCGTILPPDEAD